MALVGAVALVAAGAGDDGGRGAAAATADAPVRVPDLRECRQLGAELANACYTRAYMRLVHGRRDPRPAVKAIADNAWKEGASLLANCHGIMHTVGRTYATERHLTLGTLMDYLPQSNDPGCTAGFAHGMVTAVAPDIDPTRPGEAARVCGSARTRYQEYSCIHGFGHAFMRIYGDRLSRRSSCARRSGARRGRLRPGRLPRLLVRGDRGRRHVAAGRAGARPAAAVRRRAGALRAAVLVPHVAREPHRGLQVETPRTSMRSAPG